MTRNMPRRPYGSLPPTFPSGRETTTPEFPKRQMLVLAICRFCEPIAFMGIFPYIYYMISDFHVTKDDSEISFYAGMVTSAFTFAEFSTGFLWGRLSDKVGRKPVLLTGLTGTAISVLIFGLAPNLYVALAARVVGGLLNGNMGVLQSTVTELVTAKEHQPRAYTIMPLVWCLGSIVGPMIGGALARPCQSYPSLFSSGTIWEKYPYLLPNLFSAVVCVVGIVNGILFLEETHSEKKKCRDRGLEIGDWLLSHTCLGRFSSPVHHRSMGCAASERQPLLLKLPTDEPVLPVNEGRRNSIMNLPRNQVSQIFTRPVILNVIAFGILAFHTMVFDSLLPVFLSTEVKGDPARSLPFKFVGGFGFDTKTIGLVLSAQGIYSLFINAGVVPWVIKRMGPLHLFRFLAISYFLLYLITPYLALLPERYSMVGMYIILIWKCTFSTLSYPSNAILTANSAPGPSALGTINGVAASTASLCRGFGPTLSGMLYAVGLRVGYSGLVWWSTALVALVGGYVAMQIPDQQNLSEKVLDDIEAASSIPQPSIVATAH